MIEASATYRRPTTPQAFSNMFLGAVIGRAPEIARIDVETLDEEGVMILGEAIEAVLAYRAWVARGVRTRPDREVRSVK